MSRLDEAASTGGNMADVDTRSNRWESRSIAGYAVAAGVLLGPVVVAFVAALILAAALPSPRTGGGRLLWWAAIVLIPAAIFFVADWALKRWLPVAGLLRMTMVFPDKAPTRMAVARKVGSTRDLARRLEEAKAAGVDDDPTVAAERILGLASALNNHDRLTRGHCERVRVLADMIGEQMKLPQQDRDRLRWSSLLHDIGKLGVHAYILNKPGKLTDEEYAEVRNHPTEGARIAHPLAEWLGPWANTIAEHHEKYDGSGYPNGLAAEQISLGGRIVAVADSYEVMTAVRSYKKAASAEEARTELANCAGTHFDPDVVRAFLQISIGDLRRAGGLLAWLGAFVGRRGSQIARRATVASHSAAAGVVLIAAMSVAAAQHGAFGLPALVSTRNLILNGSFESPRVCPTGYVTIFKPSSELTDWTQGDVSVDLICTYWKSENGKQSLDMSGTPGPGEITQIVPTVAGTAYDLSWYLAANPTCGQPVKTLDVFWGGRLVDAPTFDATGHDNDTMGWERQQITVVATSSTTSVGFADATPDKSTCGSALDNVTLRQAP